MEGHGGTLMKDARQEHPIAGMQVQQQPPATGAEESPEPPTPMWKIVLVSAIASGVQFGWALQLSLLTPYVQLLGIPHKWAGYIWLCGPISGMIVQPVVGHYSDHCTSRFGRRRPFIASGAALVACAVFLIGFAADIGHISGDHLGQVAKPRAIAIFVVGFWVLDVANNMLQGPIRAFMADLSGGSSRKTRMANAFYSFFMAVGNVLGYAAGSYNGLYKIFSFTQTRACDTYCANLKSCFLISIFLLLVVTILALIIVKEKVHSPDDVAEDDNVDATMSKSSTSSSSCRIPFFGELWGALKELPRPMWILLLVTCLNWIGWFPFLLYDTDWMGREVYGGDNQGGPDHQRMYLLGVRQGSLGLMVNAVVLGFMSLAVEPMGRWLGGVKRLWGVVNFILAICLALTVLITKSAQANRQYTVAPDGGRLLAPPIPSVRIGALTLFAALGIPLAITFSIPFALASILSSTAGSGQGLSLGVLNLAIVFPQMFVSFASGPWDAIFGGGNLPAFVVGAIAAAASGLFALFLLPSPPPDIPQSKFTGAGGFH